MSGVSSINDFLGQNQAQANSQITSAQNKDKVTPQGRLSNGTISSLQSSTNEFLGNNPIIATGTDIINSVVGPISQSLAKQAIKTVTGALQPLQTAADAFFTTLSLLSTASVEVAMELARGNARLIVSTIQEKEKVITQLNTEATALYNAVSIILNSQPYFTAYLQKLLQAYSLMTTADNDLKSVVAALKTKTPYYNNTLFDQAMGLLNQAETLILPDNSAQVNQIRSGNLSTGNNSVAQAKNAQAAAASIVGISAQIAKLMVQYALLTEEINGLIALFLTALSSFISTYQRNSNIDQATINHINSGISQLDSLLASMKPLLFPTPAVKGDPLYSTKVTSYATSWGIKLAAIIEWLKTNPGTASQKLNITGESVRRYNQAVALLQGYGNRTYGSATLLVTQSQEDYFSTGTQVAQILFDANTVLATTKDPRNVLAEMKKFLDLLAAAHSLDSDIVNALTPFINTPNNLIAGADKIVSDLVSTARGLGFDRVADLIGKGDVTNLFASNATTSTYVGSALSGVRAIIGKLNSNPNATDQDKAKLSKVDNDLSSQNAVKQVEASRSATDTTDTFVADKNAQVAATNQDGQSAIQVASKYDSTEAASQSKVDKLSGIYNNVTGTAFGGSQNA